MFPAQRVKHTGIRDIFLISLIKVSAKDCPKRRAGKKSGERRAGEGFQDQRESWADLGYGWVREER